MKIEKVIEELQRAIAFGPGRLISVEALKVAVAVLEDAKDRGFVEVLPRRVETISADVTYEKPENAQKEAYLDMARHDVARHLAKELLSSKAVRTTTTITTSPFYSRAEQLTFTASVDVLIPEEVAKQ